MTEQNDPEITPEELAQALADMTPEERLAAAREALAGEQGKDQDQQFYDQLVSAADADEAPRKPAAEEAFRRLLGR
jgi:UDP-N-acetylglucosamine:LPS N-acetylglucosamine transferase